MNPTGMCRTYLDGKIPSPVASKLAPVGLNAPTECSIQDISEQEVEISEYTL